MAKFIALTSLLAGLVPGASVPTDTTPIGVITASGHFTVEGSQVWGNSTLFDGATVETGAASSELKLRNGVRVQLGAGSKARIWTNRLLIETGVGQVSAPESFSISAADFEIHTALGGGAGAGMGSRVRVGLGAQLEVTALAGAARVAGRNGLPLASIAPGRSAGIALQAAQSGVVSHTGCLLGKNGQFILQDDDSQEVIQLNGPDLRTNMGNRVQVTGRASTAKPSVQPATSVLDVTTVSPRSQGGCLSVASALDAQANAAAPDAGAPPASQGTAPATATAKGTGGLSTGAKIGIIAAIGGAGAGAAVLLSTSGSKKSTSP